VTEVSAPSLTVIIVASHKFSAITRTLRHLRAQTIVGQIELIVLGPTEAVLNAHDPADIAGFHSVKLLPIGTISNVDKSYVRALPHASALAVAFVEDHAYPQPMWAEAIVNAYKGGWSAVGSTMVNANPGSMWSWANSLIAYGNTMEPAFTGERGSIGLHNASFHRDILLAYGDALADKMGRDGGLLDDIKAKGGRLYLPSKALLAHANPSRFSSTLKLRFSAGRSYGAQRAEKEGWSFSKRMVYIAGGVLIPVVRFVRMRRDMARLLDHHNINPRVLPALFAALVMDGAGQMVGYAFGSGNSHQVLAVFEMDRIQHLNRVDRRLLQES
jgi:hypothetical protein